jgi:hypothetical protein
MIFLWGMDGDPPLDAVRRALDRRKARYFFLDQRAILDTEVHLDVGVEARGHVRHRGQELRFEEVTASYIRPDDSRQLADVSAAGPQSRAWLHALSVEDALLSWTEVTPALVINRPSAMASNASKPYQLELIHALGFETPETLVTTDPDAALAFWNEHEEVIYKSVSSVRSKVARMTPQHLDRLGQVATCPTQFQEYVPGIDYRVHVVGESVFGCSVESEGDDYRYAPSDVSPCALPAFVAARARDVAAGLGLILAGLDLRRTPEDGWVCFEANPSPAFTFYDRLEGEPIAAAIAGLLASAGARPGGKLDEEARSRS